VLKLPYVTPGAFAAHPTFLDLLNLRSGDLNLDDQVAELSNVLRMASAWADNFVAQGQPNGSLAAHTAVESERIRIDRSGLIKYHPAHVPVISVQSIAVGASPSTLTTYTNPPVWVEDGRQVVFDMGGVGNPWSGALQFGTPTAGSQMYTRWAYTAGYPNALLTSASSPGATSIGVSDPTGVEPGSALRIWDPGFEEVITVADTYTVGAATLPLTAGLAYGHDGTVDTIGVSGLPDDVHLAVIMYGVVLLMHPDTTAEDAFAGARVDASTRAADARTGGAGLIAEAETTLAAYRRVR
jgi:hypothetical protein